MTTSTLFPTKHSVIQNVKIFENIFKSLNLSEISIRLWDGTLLNSKNAQRTPFTLVIKHPGALRKMFLNTNDLSLGEAYIFNDFDIEGDLESVFKMADKLLNKSMPLLSKIQLMMQLLKLPVNEIHHHSHNGPRLSGPKHSKERDLQAVTYHYNVSNEFYTLWLDPHMVYSCAYFASPQEDLDIAQERKLDYICRKLRLRPGETLLDIGCGWGGLIRYAAKNYGVKAMGITLSEPQSLLARRQIDNEKLSSQCKVEICDYRDLDESRMFDKIVSVGMYEHVGEAKLPEYFQKIWRMLKKGGVFLNHGIALGQNQPVKKGPSFSDKYVFPDSQLIPIHSTLKIVENCGFEIRDLENLREHYMLTLRSWLRRLEMHHDAIVGLTDETTYRIWRLNHAGSAHGFMTGRLAIYQALLLKPDDGNSGLPLTRSDWYTERTVMSRMNKVNSL